MRASSPTDYLVAFCRLARLASQAGTSAFRTNSDVEDEISEGLLITQSGI